MSFRLIVSSGREFIWFTKLNLELSPGVRTKIFFNNINSVPRFKFNST